MVESKPLLYSILAGLLTGIVFTIVFAVRVYPGIEDFIYEVVFHRGVSNGLSMGEAEEMAREAVRALTMYKWIFIATPIIDSFIMGIVLGLVLDILINKAKLKPPISSIVTGLLLLFIQLSLLLITVSAAGPWLLKLIEKYVGVEVIIAYPLTYTAILFILNTFKGPWIKLGEAKPEMY